MPRSNRPRRQPGQRPGPVAHRSMADDGPSDVSYQGLQWMVRQVRGSDSGRTFRCPGCQQEVSAATPHTVVWPSETMHGVENRRHWHAQCWAARDRRRPGGSFA
ncbi:MAG: hypothetical protein WA962_05345 [Ornithinimicrobium sp.]